YLGDGAAWVWGLKADRLTSAHGLLDFYHASQHLWEVGRVLHGETQPALRAWVEPRRHQFAPRARVGGAGRNRPAEKAAWGGGKNPGAGAALLCQPRQTDELSGSGAARLAHRERGGGKRVPAKQGRFKRGGQ